MRIAICDDDIADLKLLVDYLRDIIAERRLECEFDAFESSENLLVARQNAPYHIYFLDIYMTGVTGIQAAYQIRDSEPDACIIFTTSSSSHMADGFEVGAVHYVMKPLTLNAVAKAIDRCLRLIKNPEKFITLLVDRIPQKILLSEILVVESSDKYSLLTTKTGIIQSYIRLNNLETVISDERFLRCHRSFLINMDYAIGVVDGTFKMTNGMIIPIKRDKRKEMKQRFSEYCFNKLRKG